MGLSFLEVVVARELTFCVRLNHSKQLHRMEVVHLSFNVRIRLTHSVQRKKKALGRVLTRAVGPNNAGGWPLKPEKAAEEQQWPWRTVLTCGRAPRAKLSEPRIGA